MNSSTNYVFLIIMIFYLKQKLDRCKKISDFDNNFFNVPNDLYKGKKLIPLF